MTVLASAPTPSPSPTLLSVLLFALLSSPAFGLESVEPIQPLPPAALQDNELILGLESGAWFAQDEAAHKTQAGGSAAVWVGLLNRVFAWLDAELAMGAVLLWSSDAITQTSPQRSAERFVMPGGAIRLGARLLWPSTGLGLDTGLRAGVYAAPLAGAFARVELEVGLSLDLWRDPREHGTVSILYGLPLWDGLTQEPGMPFEGWTHHLFVRGWIGF